MKLRHTAALALVLVQMAGCWSTSHGIVGATASETYTADGRPGYTIHCDGALLSWSTCSAKAGELCETRGYDILEKPTWGFPIARTMLVACKPDPDEGMTLKPSPWRTM
jgi:hypothetical protein